MKRLAFLVLFVSILTFSSTSARNYTKERNGVLNRSEGYYKELFMDSGMFVTSRRTLPAASYLGLRMEYFASATNDNLTQTDTLKQNAIFIGSDIDTNGWLLYPDGEPRYRAIYVNGGGAARHAKGLTKAGCKAICDFVNAGGSYIGTCAGAYLATAGSMRRDKKPRYTDLYLHLWPGIMHSTHLRKSHTPLKLEAKNPLSRYYDFGKDNIVDSVRHNGGGYGLGDIEGNLPAGTEVLARYIFKDNKRVKINDRPAIWAYKESKQSGRVIMIGSHPEPVKSGERRDLMAAALLYAMDGNGEPNIKGRLTPNTERAMNKRTEDNLPHYTRIGDRQYHHFEVDVPKGCKSITITLKGYEGEDNYDLTLCAKEREIAFASNTKHINDSKGCYKELKITKPKAGKWFISVLNTTTVNTITDTYGTEYITGTDVLNGVPYIISVAFEI